MLAMPLFRGGMLLAGIVRVPSKPMPAHLPEILALCAVASVVDVLNAAKAEKEMFRVPGSQAWKYFREIFDSAPA